MMDDEFANAQPTAVDYAAADEALLRQPQGGPEQTARAREVWARIHQVLGSAKFGLMFGLRPPQGIEEECEHAFMRGEITEEECVARFETHAKRPFDREMLLAFFDRLQARLSIYGRIQQLVVEYCENPVSPLKRIETEKQIRKFVNDLKANPSPDESVTVLTWLDEMHAARGDAFHILCGIVAVSAAGVAILAFKHLSEYWKYCEAAAEHQPQPPDLGGRSAASLYYEICWPKLPLPNELTAAVLQEWATAKNYLRERRERRRRQKERAHRTLIVEHQGGVDLTIHDANESAVDGGKGTTPKLVVTEWSQLAIGIDEKKNFWALSPAPDFGGPFLMGQAVSLKLGGARWPRLLELFGDSADGSSARRHDVLAAFDMLPGGSTLNTDPRQRPHSAEAALNEEMPSIRKKALNELNAALATLGNALREQVKGPKGSGGKALCIDPIDKTLVRAGFTVRYLIKDGGHVLFGPRRI